MEEFLSGLKIEENMNDSTKFCELKIFTMIRIYSLIMKIFYDGEE